MVPATDPDVETDELIIRRVFDAPRELVFRMWSESEHAIRWMGPLEFPAVSFEQDARVGGTWRSCLRSIEDPCVERWQHGEYLAIDPPRHIAYTFCWDDGEADTIVTVDFAEVDDKTEIVVRQSPFRSTDSLDGHREGWGSALEVLAAYLLPWDKGMPNSRDAMQRGGVGDDIDAARRRMWEERNVAVVPGIRQRPAGTGPDADEGTLVIERRFAAPRELVFKMWSEPQHRAMWWGPLGHGLEEIAMDLRPGGAWAVTILNPDGTSARMHGVFTEIDPPTRLCFTYVFDAVGIDSRVEIDFFESGSGTRMLFRQGPFPAEAERASHSWGWSSSFVQFTQYLQHLLLSPPGTRWERRRDGVVADLEAARERAEASRRNGGPKSPRAGDEAGTQ